MTNTQIKKIDNLRRSIYKKEEFLVRVSELLKMFTFLDKNAERVRAVSYIRKEILKEMVNTDLKAKIKEQIDAIQELNEEVKK